MHIIITIITALAGLVWALYRLQNSGVDLNSFNPFWWLRRRKWQRLHGTKPLHQIQSSMECAAVLVTAAALLDGVITREQKSEVIALFTQEFKLDPNTATELFASANHLLTDTANIVAEVKYILAPTVQDFNEVQINSVLSMIQKISTVEGDANAQQLAFKEAVEREFMNARTRHPRSGKPFNSS